jgi:alginate O-acetyltransferase complex protein AlgI
MSYSNYDFLLLLPLLVALFYAAKSEIGQLGLLLVVSAIFLAWTTIWNLLPAVIVILAVYAFLRIDERRRLPTFALAALIVFLVAQLAYFRYRAFLSASIGVEIPAPALISWLIPLGISFYTFEAISAAVDLYRRRQPVKLMTWSLFIMFLPHLIAGPIVRYRQLVPQFAGRKALRFRNLGIGLHFFTIGFCKKLAADPLGQVIDPFWAAPSQASSLALLLALIGFFCQLYLDFSGYTDMGRGVARMLGYRLPLNFRAPAFSVTPSEFYQRWHVSLSSWIRTFVYDTLAVAVLRRVRSRKLQNYALLGVVLWVMALFGLWHGSAWHYVLFGIAQGFVIVAWQAYNRGRPPKSRKGRIASCALLQLTWLFSLILFRGETLRLIGSFLGGMLRPTGWFHPNLAWCLVALCGTLLAQSVEYFVSYRPLARCLCFLRATRLGVGLMGVLFLVALALKILVDVERMSIAGTGGIGTGGFIYFRF